MTSPPSLSFDLRGSPLTFPVVEVESSVSPYTGKSLRKLQTIFTVSPVDAGVVKDFLAAALVEDADGTFWSGQLDTESYTDNGPHSLVITWSESEPLHADSVEFEGLALTPTRYEERAKEDGSIAIAFQATLSEEQTAVLRALITTSYEQVRYWPVVRHGVSDQPRTMRLGRVLWQPFEDGSIGHDITLVDEGYDSTITPGLLAFGGEPQVSNLVQQLSALTVQFETLLAKLEGSGAIDPEAVANIRESADKLSAARRYDFFRVSDLSKW